MKPETIITKNISVEIGTESFQFFITNDYAAVVKEVKRLKYKIPLLVDYLVNELYPNEVKEKMIEQHSRWAIFIAEDCISVTYLDEKINSVYTALIQEKADEKTLDKKQLLFEYASLNKASEIEQLINEGIDVDSCDVGEITALMYAANFDSPDAVRTLIKLGADVNARDKIGWTALMWAACENACMSAEELLKSSELNIEEKNNVGVTALSFAVSCCCEDVFKLLIEAGADVNTKTVFDFTPLHCCANYNLISFAEILIKNGSDINPVDNEGMTPIMLAVCFNNVEISEILLSAGADITIKGSHGFSVFKYAAENDSFDCLSLLLKKCNIPDYDLFDAIEVAARKGHTRSLKLLVDKSEYKEASVRIALKYACIGNKPDIIVFCKEYKYNFDSITSFFMTPLMITCYCHSTEAAAELIRAGVDVNCADEYGITALMYASMVNAPNIVMMLLDNGADRTAKDKDGKTFEDYSKINETRPIETFEACKVWNKIQAQVEAKLEAEISEKSKPFIERFQWYKQKYFERFPNNKDSDIYNAAEISKQTFSNIKKQKNKLFHPNKPTVIQLALGLRLNIEEAKDLLQSAGYALSEDDKTDILVKKFITEQKTNPYELNEYAERISGNSLFPNLRF